MVTDEYDPIMAEVIRDQPPELTPLDALRAMLREMLPQLYADDLEVIREGCSSPPTSPPCVPARSSRCAAPSSC